MDINKTTLDAIKKNAAKRKPLVSVEFFTIPKENNFAAQLLRLVYKNCDFI